MFVFCYLKYTFSYHELLALLFDGSQLSDAFWKMNKRESVLCVYLEYLRKIQVCYSSWDIENIFPHPWIEKYAGGVKI